MLNLLLLGIFKYANFFLQNISAVLGREAPLLSIALPIGISFYTFQTISYVLDVYRGQVPAQKTYYKYLMYLSSYHQLVAGPIVRYSDVAAEIENRTVSVQDFSEGITKFCVGLTKKVVVANTAGQLVAQYMDGQLAGLSVAGAWFGALLYAIQLYYDFSAYSDIAIGLSELFGIRMKENFNFPYLSRSITEFWRRWHISLGTWFREYLYIPLGGNRKGRGRTLLNLFAVFLVTGIWHGAGYNYILWGVINGVMIVLERCVRDKGWYQKIPGLVRWAFTMFVVLMSWQVFRLESLSGIAQFFGILFGALKFAPVNFTWQYYFDARIVVLMVIATVGALALDGGWAKKLHAKIRSSVPLFCVAQLALLLLMVLSVMCMINSTYSPFIYFQY